MFKKTVSFAIVFAIFFTSLGITQEVFASTPTIRSDFVFAFTNAERRKVGRSALLLNDTLSSVAREKMLDLFARQYFAHESPSGESVSDLAKNAGYKFIVVGENLAMGNFSSSKAVVDAWMNSPGHKKNILSETYSEIGIAAGRGMYDDRETWMIVQSFGYPSSKCPVVDFSLENGLKKFDAILTVYSAIAEKRKESLSLKTGTLEERQTRVNLYNAVARQYNKTVGEYEAHADTYNKAVEKYNACVKKVTSKLK